MKRSPGLLFTTFLIGLLLHACSKPLTVEQQIISVIREMETRIENGERRAFMSHVSAEFNGQNGQLNHAQLRAMVILQLNRHQRLHAQLFPIRVKETATDSATAEFRALITGGPRWLPESGQVFAFDTQWRKQDGDWLLHAATWTPVPLEEVL
jgi:hypothetical protein